MRVALIIGVAVVTVTTLFTVPDAVARIERPPFSQG